MPKLARALPLLVLVAVMFAVAAPLVRAQDDDDDSGDDSAMGEAGEMAGESGPDSAAAGADEADATLTRQDFERRHRIPDHVSFPMLAPNAELLAECFDFGPWLANDVEDMAAKLLECIRTQPDSISTLALLSLHGWALRESDDPSALARTLIEVSDGGDNLAIFGANARRFATELIDAAKDTGNVEAARKAERSTAGLGAFNGRKPVWLVAGPFGDDQSGDMWDVVLPPELRVATTARMQGAYGQVTWKPFTPEVEREHVFDTRELSQRDGSGWFAMTEIVSEAERDALLDFEIFDGGAKAWLNGKMVFNRKPWRDASRDDVALVTLPAGRSTLLIKMGASTRAGVRVCDPFNRLTLQGVVHAELPGNIEPFVPRGNAAPTAMPIPPGFQRLWTIAHSTTILDDLPGPGADEAAALLALELADASHPELAEDFWLKCADWRRADPVREACLDLLYASKRTLAAPEKRQRKRRERLTELTLSHPDVAIRAWLELAALHGQENRETEAAKCLDKAIALDKSWRSRMAAARFYQSKGWSAEERSQRLAAFESTQTPSPRVVYDRARLAVDDSDNLLALKLVDSLLAGPWKGSLGLINWRRAITERLGRFDESLAMLDEVARIEGGETRQMKRDRAKLLAASGEWQKAVELYLAVAEDCPARPQNDYQSAGMLAYRRGDKATAARALGSALEHDPGNDTVRRYLDRLEGRDVPLLPEWSTPWTDDAFNWLKAEDYPLAVAGYLLDEEVWIVSADGSHASYGQRSLKLFKQDAVDRFGRGRIEGEVIRVRTLAPGGKAYEPTTVTGSSFEYPQVAPGNVIDYAYRTHEPGSEHHAIEDRSFFFAEDDTRIPTALARLVVVCPPGFGLHYRTYNATGLTHKRETLGDGRTVDTWEYRKPRSVETEVLMPDAREYVPTVEFTRSANDWAVLARRLREQLAEPKVTWLVEATANEILRDHDGGDSISAAHALYDWVNANIVTEGGSRNPHGCIEELSGDRQELFVALLEAAGISYQVVHAARHHDRERQPRYFDLESMFANRLVLIDDGERRVFVDTQLRQAPFGSIDIDIRGGAAVFIDPETGRWWLGEMPGLDGVPDGEYLDSTVVIGANGSADVTGTIEIRGHEGYAIKESVRETPLTEHKRNLESDLSSSFTGLVVADFELPGLDELGSEYKRKFRGTMAQACQQDGQALRFELPVEETGRMIGRYVELPTRNFDLIIRRPLVKEDKLTIALPEGYTLESVPDDFVLPAGPFIYALTFTRAGSLLKVTRSLQLKPARIPAANYLSFREQVRAISAAETRPLVLIPVNGQ